MRVNQQIGHHLLDFLKMSVNWRNFFGNLLIDSGHVSSDLCSHNHQRSCNYIRNGDHFFLCGFIGTGKFLQTRDNPADTVGTDFKRLDNLPHITAHFLIGQTSFLPVGMVRPATYQNILHRVPDLFQNGNIVRDKADRIVDLMGNTRNYLTQRSQFVCLNHLLES